jgi:hypothetical protein
MNISLPEEGEVAAAVVCLTLGFGSCPAEITIPASIIAIRQLKHRILMKPSLATRASAQVREYAPGQSLYLIKS